MKSKILNMTEGNPTALLLTFSIPMFIGNIFQQMYNLVDSVIVGQFIGKDALAAVGSTSTIGFLFFALCNGVASGGGIITSQYFGSGDEDNVKSSILNSGYILMLMSFVIGIIAALLSKPLLIFLNTPANIYDDALIYMYMQCLGLPLVGLYNYASSMLRALGDSKTPLYFLIFASILNVGLDLLFVCVFHWGVLGAALATGFAQLISGMSCLIYALRYNPYFKMERKHFRIQKNIIFGTLRIGIPLSLQFSLIAISCMALQRVVNGFGPAAVAAFTATGRVEQLLHQPYGTLCAALSTYSGQNLGAKKHDRIRLGFRKSLIMMTIFSLIMLPLMQFGSEAIIKIFVNDAEVIRYGATGLRITSIFYLFLGVIYMIRGVLNGVGDAAFSLINGIVEVVCRITIPLFITTFPLIGVWGIWWSTGITWVISALFCVIRYKFWKKKIFV